MFTNAIRRHKGFSINSCGILRLNGIQNLQHRHNSVLNVDTLRQTQAKHSKTNTEADKPLLQKIWMNDRSIGAQGAITMARTMNWHNVKELHLGGNQIGNRGTAAIVEKITGSLEKLSLFHNNIGVEGAEAIADALNRTKNVKSLWLHDNQLGNRGVRKLARVAYSLRELWLGDNLIGDKGLKQLADALSRPASLQSLWLHNNQIGNEGVIALAKALHKDMDLRIMCFSDNNIGATGAEALGEALIEGNSPLEELKLRGNKVGDIGAIALARSIKSNIGHLVKLNLSHNNIGPVGAIALAEAMEVNTKIYQLCVRGNPIGKEGAAALAACRSPERVIYF